MEREFYRLAGFSGVNPNGLSFWTVHQLFCGTWDRLACELSPYGKVTPEHRKQDLGRKRWLDRQLAGCSPEEAEKISRYFASRGMS